MVRQFRPFDEGSSVFTSEGDKLGTVTSVSKNRIHVRPHATIAKNIRQTFGWEGNDETYELGHSTVDDIDDGEIHLKETF